MLEFELMVDKTGAIEISSSEEYHKTVKFVMFIGSGVNFNNEMSNVTDGDIIEIKIRKKCQTCGRVIR